MASTADTKTMPDIYSDWCLSHNKLSTAVVRYWIGEQKLDSYRRDKKADQNNVPATGSIEENNQNN